MEAEPKNLLGRGSAADCCNDELRGYTPVEDTHVASNNRLLSNNCPKLEEHDPDPNQ